MFDAIAFAGGGNRCYWQGGFWDAAREDLGLAPRLVVGASAGAWQAAYSLLGLIGEVRPTVISACGPHLANFDWRRRSGSPTWFPVAGLYRELVTRTLRGDALARINALTDFRIALARPPRWLPAQAAPWLGLAAYQIEKRLFAPVHPRFGRALGFEPEFVPARTMRTTAELIDALMATATVPPIMPILRIGGRIALDGGLVDNVPVEPLAEIERAGGRTLVLLTRRYDALPEVPGRLYVEPSEPIPVHQFDITDPEGIRAAFALGQRDGAAFAKAQRVSASGARRSATDPGA
ncbi:patatin-like phospholipase family protein [Blastochloris tepida]|uniref:Patatin n=1 Tax=Blastochloris tepida TaxID=2233851 RepID=A0A348FZW5_9HYPH|nr:patatin-like phospholipase family protein [Blastochloris tepida]BBF92848.1 patatin [Blastochloris tepida]